MFRGQWSVLRAFALFVLSLYVLAIGGCGGSSSGPSAPRSELTVTSTDDLDTPPAGTVTLRSALAKAASGEAITFDRSLDGKTIDLSIIGEAHSILKGETYSGMSFAGYADRDYGKSALYARKNVVIDASSLPNGVTIRWAGGDTNPARVLAVYGDLTLRKVTIAGGVSKAEAISDTAQPFTLARGGGIAVWGTADLANCAIAGNKIAGDSAPTRDRGAYGGGIYSNGLVLNNCVVSGNVATGYGAAGGGIYSVGGADHTTGFGNNATLSNCAISGNKVVAQHAYGGGVFTLSGGPNNLATMHITNCTIARNLVLDDPDVANSIQAQFYFRGGGVYLGGGSLVLTSCTIAENEVNGESTLISNKPNAGGGGFAATIGNAHVVEDLVIQHSIFAGNKLNGAPADIFTGSLLNFTSNGYNLIGAVDFSQILVPIPDAMSLSRKHYPKVGDHDGIVPADVLALTTPQRHSNILSAGIDAGQNAVLWYLPSGNAVDQIPPTSYTVTQVKGGYSGWPSSSDDFLNNVLTKLRTNYSSQLGSDFGTSFGDMTGVTFYGPARTWVSSSQNAPWINFWRSLDTQIGSKLGTVILGDDFWGTYSSGKLGNVDLTITRTDTSVQLESTDQRGQTRNSAQPGDVGAIER